MKLKLENEFFHGGGVLGAFVFKYPDEAFFIGGASAGLSYNPKPTSLFDDSSEDRFLTTFGHAGLNGA